MAISGGDGSVILTTKIDDAGIKAGTRNIRSEAMKLAAEYKKTGLTSSEAMKKAWSEVDRTTAKTALLGTAGKKTTSTFRGGIEKLKASVAGLGATLMGVFAVVSLVNFSREAGKMASTTEASVQRLIDIYGKAAVDIGGFIDANARALGLSKASATSFAAVYGNLFSVWADQKTNAELTAQYLNMTAVVASKTGRTMEDVQERIRSGLLGNTEAVEDLGIFVNIKTIEMTDAFKRMANGKSWDQLDAYAQQQVRTMAILEQSTQKYGTSVANTTAFTRLQYSAAFQDFKNTWGRVVNIILMPILRVATSILNTLTAGLQVIAGLSGKTIDSSKIQSSTAADTANSIGGAVDNQNDLADATKKTVKEQKKLLAGFDKIDKLSQDTAADDKDVDGVAGGSPAGNNLRLDTLGGDIDESGYASKLAAIGMISGTALVGLGIVLMFSGHPIIGIGMVATGFVLSAGAVEGAKDLGAEEKKKLAVIGTVAGTVLLGLGVILLFTPSWKLGLGMVAAGAIDIYGSLTIGKFSKDVRALVSEILVISGLVAFTLGVILLFVNKAGMWKYGLGLMALGVAEVVTASAFGGAELKTELQTFVTTYWGELYGIGILMVVVGVVLLFANAAANWKYALTLIGLGIADLVIVTELGGDMLKTELEKFATTYWKTLYGIGILMVVVGIALLFINAAVTWKCALTLIALGIADIVLTTELGGDALRTELETFASKYWKTLYAIGALMVVVGILLLFVPNPLMWGVGLTLIGLGIADIVTATSLSGDTIKAELMTFVTTFKDEIIVISTLLFVLGVVLLFTPLFGVGLALLGLSAAGLWTADTFDSNGLKSQLTTQLDDLNTVAETGVGKINKTLSGIGGKSSLTGGGDFSGGGGTRGITVPGYAQGKVIPPNNPHLAMVGDNTREAEVISPISTLKAAFKEAIIESGIGRNASADFVIEVDGREFGRAVIEQGNRESRRVGTRLVMA